MIKMDKKSRELVNAMVDVKEFVTKYTGWHCVSKTCILTNKAVKALEELGVIEVNEFNQMRKI